MSTQTDTIGIGDFWLDYEMYWVDEQSWNNIRFTGEDTVDGGTSIQIVGAADSARPLTLNGVCHKSTVDSLNSLADVVAATYTCTIRSTSYSVMFIGGRNAVEMQPIIPNANPDDDFPYRGNIKLIIL